MSIFLTAQATSKNNTRFKGGQRECFVDLNLKNFLATLPRVLWI